MQCQKCGTENILEDVRCLNCRARLNPIQKHQDQHFENKIIQLDIQENEQKEIARTDVEDIVATPKNSVFSTIKKMNELKFKVSIIILCVLPFLGLFLVLLSKFYLQPKYEAEKLTYAEKIGKFSKIKHPNSQGDPNRVQDDWELRQISLSILNMQMTMIQASQYFQQHQKLATTQVTIQKTFTQIYFDQYGNIIGKPTDDPKKMLIYHPIITRDQHLEWQCIAVNIIENKYLKNCLFSHQHPFGEK